MMGSTSNEVGNSITTDAIGNVYTTGYFQGTVDFDPGIGMTNLISNGNDDIFIQKLVGNGNLLWAISMGDVSGARGTSITTDVNGNVYITGNISGTVDFDPGAGVVNLTSSGSNDIFIQKLDGAGNFLWANVMGGTSVDFGRSITTDVNGNVYLTGRFNGTADFDPGVGILNLTSNGSDDIFIQKFDGNGNFLWVNTIGGGGADDAWSITTDPNGNVYTIGEFRGTVDFDPGAGIINLTSNGGSDIFIQKLDGSGNLLWVKAMGGTSVDVGRSITADSAGNLYTTGGFIGTVDFDPGVGTMNLTSNGGVDIFIQKLDTNGNFLWAKAAGDTNNDDFGYSITIDTNGNVYTTGVFHEIVDFDPGVGVMNLTSNGGKDIFIQSLDSSGDLLWVKAMGGTGTDYGNSITTDLNGSVYTTGYFQGTVDFDPGIGIMNLISNGNIDIFVQKLSACAPSTSTSLHTSCDSYTWNGTTYNSSGIYTFVTTNAAGCDSTATLDLTVEDVIAPVADISTLSDVTDECEVTTLTAPTGTDNCSGVVTVTNDATLPISTQGTAVVTWTYTDVNGNTSTQTQDVVITDITGPLADITTLSDVTDECSVTTLANPTATDNCGGLVTVSNDATLPISTQGTTVVTWTYTDVNGNTSTQTQNVVITDITAPAADIAALSDVTDECSVTTLANPTATDNCGGLVTVSNDATLPISIQGTTVVTWMYTDMNGNTSIQTQDVVITDATAPAADLANLSDINDECEVTPIAPTATDNCSGVLTGTPDVGFPITANGTTTVTWTYNDGNGNSTTQMQDVVITPIDNGITQVDAVTLSADAAGYSYQWVDCDNGNAAILGATSQSFTPTIAGNYACEIDNGTCTVTTACLNSSVGITENNFGAALVVYPNPTTGNLKIDLGDVYNEISIKVFNPLGQVIINENFGTADEINIEIEGSARMYILEINTEEGRTARVNVIKK
jgi:hypothetical protein